MIFLKVQSILYKLHYIEHIYSNWFVQALLLICLNSTGGLNDKNCFFKITKYIKPIEFYKI